jgi:hypothetical protein
MEPNPNQAALNESLDLQKNQQANILMVVEPS